MSEPVPWNPKEPWTHPSVQRLSTEELRAKVRELEEALARDRGLFADHPDRETVAELIGNYHRQISQYRSALGHRGANG